MKYKIGIFGSSSGDLTQLKENAHELGKVLSKHDVILITGAASGLPYEVVKTAHDESENEIWGFSPAKDFDGEKQLNPQQDSSIYTKYFFVPSKYAFIGNVDVCRKFRNVTSTANCDAGIIISGRWGTMNEFTNLYDMGKVIGVLTKTGGIADELVTLYPKINKPGRAKVLFSNSPQELVSAIISELLHRNK